MNNTRIKIILLYLIILPWSLGATEQEGLLTLQECVDYALENNPDVRIDRAGEDEARATRRSSLGRFGPVLSADMSYIRWDSPSEISFAGSPPMTTREQETSEISVTATQPLTNLWTIAEAYQMADYGLDIAQLKKESTVQAISYQVIETYFKVLQARNYVRIGQKSKESVEAHVHQVSLFYDQGLIPISEYLKAKVGLAKVEEGVIKARSGEELALAYLGNLLGLPSDRSFSIQEWSSDRTGNGLSLESEFAQRLDESKAYIFNVDGNLLEMPLVKILDHVLSGSVSLDFSTVGLLDLQSRAVSQRPESRMVTGQIGAAGAGKRLAISNMLPSVALTASHVTSEGSEFQDEESWFVGAFLSWNFWEWGATYHQVKAADAQLEKALIGQAKLEDYIRLEVKQAFLKLNEARESLDVASASIASAAEALRIEKVRFEQHIATSTDVLEAESMYTEAETSRATAQYDFLIAVAAFRKALGRFLM
ncbi:TolC family protein [bacterium]|nr:TolC family protein [bacterium]